MSYAVDAKERIKLRDGVSCHRRSNDIVLLIPPEGTAPVRINRIGEELLPLLFKGTTREQLETILIGRKPSCVDVSLKLMRFLSMLADRGLLESSRSNVESVPKKPFRLRLFDLDPTVRVIAVWINKTPCWLRWFFTVVSVIWALFGIVMVLLETGQSIYLDIYNRFDFIGLVLFVLLVVPSHELAHAVACRLSGTPVSEVGIVFHHRFLPGPYVNTTQGYRVTERWNRFKIPAAGPFTDLFFCGLASWAVMIDIQNLQVSQTANFVMILSLLILYFNMNPFTPSDGSHMLESLMNDELLREVAVYGRKSGFTNPKAVMVYRLACVLYLVVFIVTVVWITMNYIGTLS